MATPGVRAVDSLPKHMKDAVIAHLIAGKPLRAIAELCGINKDSLRQYRDDIVLPKLAVLPEYGNVSKDQTVQTTQQTDNKPLTSEVLTISKEVQTSIDKTRVIGEVQAQVIALRKRAENVLTRVESRPDEEFSGREWASVATVAARMIETQGRMTGELSDRAGSGDVNIQINMPATARPDDGRTIDVDLLKPLKSTDQS